MSHGIIDARRAARRIRPYEATHRDTDYPRHVHAPARRLPDRAHQLRYRAAKGNVVDSRAHSELAQLEALGSRRRRRSGAAGLRAAGAPRRPRHARCAFAYFRLRLDTAKLIISVGHGEQVIRIATAGHKHCTQPWQQLRIRPSFEGDHDRKTKMSETMATQMNSLYDWPRL